MVTNWPSDRPTGVVLGPGDAGYCLGVDLGTTFVAAAISRDTHQEMLTLGDRTVVAPSVVYLREDGSLVTGDAANRRAMNDPDRVARSFKRRLGDPTPVILGGSSHEVLDLLAALLKDVLDKVTGLEGAAPDRVALTYPANWGPFRRGLFEEVPLRAGLPHARVVTEPEAAAAHYASTRQLVDGETLAVYDLGGGTFDVTLLRRRAGGIEILGTPEGIERLGGIDFDDAVLSHVNVSLKGALDELDRREPDNLVALSRLRQDCVLAKEALSVDTEVVVPVILPGQHAEVRLTRDQFEDLVRARIEQTVGVLERTLGSAQVSPDELSAVLLVGGSSRIPLVGKMVSEALGRPTVADTHPKYAVALGAVTLVAAGAIEGADRNSAVAAQVPEPVEPSRRDGSPAASPVAGPVARPGEGMQPPGGRAAQLPGEAVPPPPGYPAPPPPGGYPAPPPGGGGAQPPPGGYPARPGGITRSGGNLRPARNPRPGGYPVQPSGRPLFYPAGGPAPPPGRRRGRPAASPGYLAPTGGLGPARWPAAATVGPTGRAVAATGRGGGRRIRPAAALLAAAVLIAVAAAVGIAVLLHRAEAPTAAPTPGKAAFAPTVTYVPGGHFAYHANRDIGAAPAVVIASGR